jgi:hypothetical protein
MDPWTAVDLAMLQVDLLNFGGKFGIFSAVLGTLPVFPGVIAALGNLQRLAEQRDRVLVAVLCQELELQSWPREKMPIAFLGYHAPVVGDPLPASSGEFPLLEAFDGHCLEMLARPAPRTADTNDGAYCRQYPDRAQCVLTASDSIVQVGLLLP